MIAGTLLAFFRTDVPKASQRTLTFEERVSFQRTIEEVYWRHRVWPKERPDPKPSLDAVMSQAQLEKKVVDYVHKSQALADYWRRPITAEQLQAEMDRMAQQTKQPEVLRELFEALGNDPFVIAECLARPALAERLITNWYAYDQRIHGQLKQRAEVDLQAHPTVEQMKQLGGKYSEIELIQGDNAKAEADHAAGCGVRLNSSEWDQTVQKLAVIFHRALNQLTNRDGWRRRSFRPASPSVPLYQTLPIGKLSPLQEGDDGCYAMAVIEATQERLRLATVVWRKEPLELWLDRAQSKASTAMSAPTANYTLPEESDGAACIDNSWTVTAAPPDGRYGHTAVWTGSEMIIWGGGYGNYPFPFFRNTGARYNPSIDTWTTTSTTHAPTGRVGHTAVWTGGEMIIWGGLDGPFNVVNTGGRYDPNTDTWTATSRTNAPTIRYEHAAVWTGSEMIIWGGTGADYLNTGGRYNPNTNRWSATSTVNAPTARYGSTAVWTGSEMIVWGGTNDFTSFNTGARYNPSANSWTGTSTSNVPGGRYGHTAVWTGSEMIVWGGYDVDNSQQLNTGGRYNPGANNWTATNTNNAPTARSGHAAVWTGSAMIVWGGFDVVTITNTGGTYDPDTNGWTATSTTGAPTARGSPTAIWTGSEMIIWGGPDESGDANTGGRYNPNSDGWTSTNTYNAPQGRTSHTAVWTGNELIVWGGASNFNYFNTGSRYNPSLDTWTATSMVDPPTRRFNHTAVWTGSEMIVWGGSFYDNGYQYLNSGGRYNPTIDNWTPTNLTNAPIARDYHTAIWTGSEMIAWGGYDGFDDLNSGGLYDPVTNSWTVVSTTGAPIAREAHTAVWTGSEMIVWGGFNFNSQAYLNTGGRYNPATNSWTATETTNAPDGRSNHR